MVIPMLAAFEADAPLIECVLNIEESIPANSINDFSHLAIVLDVTAL